MFFHRPHKYKMDMTTANATLQNVFSACNQAPNTIPFDKLLLRQKANTRTYDRFLLVIGIFLLLTFLSPVFVVPAANCIAEAFEPEPVELKEYYIEEDYLCLLLSGDGICYEAAYMVTPNGEHIPPASYDTTKQLLQFPIQEDVEYNIYIPVDNSVPYHLLFTPL